MSNQHYRADIDGLRAFAVLSVMVYHALPQLMPGGFVGVDIFFVISGYLISQILYADLESGEFSLVGFYVRRMRRILPSLVVVLAACCLIADRFLLADELDNFARSLIASSSFVANIYFWGNTNYFSGLAVLQPLLHLWSLSVEEQFYLIWPIALALIYSKRINPLILAASVGLVSFVWSVHASATSPIAAFFAPQSRAWELMAGAILAWMARGSFNPFRRLPAVSADAASGAGARAYELFGAQQLACGISGLWRVAARLGRRAGDRQRADGDCKPSGAVSSRLGLGGAHLLSALSLALAAVVVSPRH